MGALYLCLSHVLTRADQASNRDQDTFVSALHINSAFDSFLTIRDIRLIRDDIVDAQLKVSDSSCTESDVVSHSHSLSALSSSGADLLSSS